MNSHHWMTSPLCTGAQFTTRVTIHVINARLKGGLCAFGTSLALALISDKVAYSLCDNAASFIRQIGCKRGPWITLGSIDPHVRMILFSLNIQPNNLSDR